MSFQQTQLNHCACRYWMLSAYISAAFWVAMSLALLTLFNLKVLMWCLEISPTSWVNVIDVRALLGG